VRVASVVTDERAPESVALNTPALIVIVELSGRTTPRVLVVAVATLTGVPAAPFPESGDDTLTVFVATVELRTPLPSTVNPVPGLTTPTTLDVAIGKRSVLIVPELISDAECE
jgi:hypothetical protein